ncbi:MAG: hypothetical protein Q8M16_08475 [Pirellulaceae bacterium]|nr:hypothetical protein [Pirellulaceae bacterium]
MRKQWKVAATLGSRLDLRLEARFEWRKDRFAHQVVMVTAATEHLCVQSVEGNDQEDFPPSPPLQDMSVEQRVGSQVALGVGMAGSAMWSLSVEAQADEGGLLFDWACQTRGARIWPRNCYFLSGDDRGANSAPAEVLLYRWKGPSGVPVEVVLTLVQTTATLPLGYRIANQDAGVLTNTPVAMNDSTGGSVLEVEGQPADREPTVPKSGTLRWQYRIALRMGVE